ncbi:zinc ABC transporter substrate-binding protein [Candidatus Dependentiae bacterium]|nr:zinc ABC transporter substrate-binding protein [Candidatus Dependentiae bacterium]
MRKLLFFILAIFILLNLVLAGCSPAEQDDTNKPIIVTTIFPLADIIKNIAGDNFEVIYLIKPGLNPHTFEPTPDTIVKINKSKLIFKVGFGFEFWLKKILSSGMTPVNLSKHITPITKYHYGATVNNGASDNENDKHGFHDPHYWLSPKNILIIIPQIIEALQKTFPEHRDTFEENSNKYTKKIKELDNYFRDSLLQCNNRKYIAYHPAWLYLSRDYDLEMVDVISKKPGQEPSPGDIAEIIEKIKAENIKAVFSEREAPQNIPNILVNETGIKLIILDPLGGSKELNSYIKLMKQNINSIKEGLCE